MSSPIPCPGGLAKVRKDTEVGMLVPNPGPLNIIELVIPTSMTAHNVSKAQDSNTRKAEQSIQASL